MIATAKKILSLFILCICTNYNVSACAACVELGDHTFDKLLSKFEASLVKFDVAFPYGEKHEAYATLAKDAVSADDLLVAEVGVKDYGEKDNENLAKRYGLTKDDFPAVRLFLKHRKEPLSFPAKSDFTTENLRKFVKEKSGIHLSLPGCLQQLDKLALKFMKADEETKRKLLKSAQDIIALFDSSEKKASGKSYELVMQRVLEKGAEFISSENGRVGKLLKGKLSEDKKKELTAKLNILKSFETPKKASTKKDEF